MMRWALALLAGAWMSATPVLGHHSLTDYASGRDATIDGVIADVQFVNPHPFLLVNVRDRSGAVQSWRLEMDNRHELVDIGMTKDTLRAGDRIVVSGSPGHTQPRIMYIRTLERPSDGYGFEQVDSRPRLKQ
jgi:hypothetical protein